MAQLRWTTVDDPSSAGQATLFADVSRRTVGIGEYRGLEFFEVEAKRLINHLPTRGPLPFDYTINTYRGCSHACSYCLDRDTPVLMADGSQRPIHKIRSGDELIGTSDLGRYRRYRRTTVTDTWTTEKPAYRLRLAGGIEVLSSGDHRFLSDGGWRYVASCGAHATPDLKPGDRLLGMASLPAAAHDEDYRLIDAAVVGDRDLIVESVDQLDTVIPMVDITTTTGDFIANGLVSHNCFARPTHDYLGFNIGDEFDSKIVVKVNAAELARAETAPARWAGHHIAMGTNTDPYQRAEGKYRLTRGVIEVLAERVNPFSILTKSSLVLRDIDVLTDAIRHADVAVDFSIPTLDEEVWKLTEPGTPHPRQRVDAVRKLNEAGIPSGALIAPIIPGLSDRPEQLHAVADALVDAGARFASPMYLHLRGRPLKDHWFDWLSANRPELLPRHLKDYEHRGNAPVAADHRLKEIVRSRVNDRGGLRNARPRSRAPERQVIDPSEQLSLGL